MALVINHNLMAMNAARNLNASFSNLGVSTRRLSSGLQRAEGDGAEKMQQTGGQAQDEAPAPQAASAPEQQTGSIVNIADNLAASAKSRLSALQGGSLHMPDLPTPDASSRLRDMGLTNDLSMESDVASRANEARVGTMIRHGQDMINSVARNAEMVASLFKGTG